MNDRAWWGQGARLLEPIREAATDEAPFFVDLEGAGAMPSNPSIADVTVVPDVLDPEECARILLAAQSQPCERGETLGRLADYRRCDCAWIPAREDTRWIYRRMAQTFEQVNAAYRFRLAGIVEPLLAVAYSEGDKFDWHLDSGSELTANRKLSLSLMLTGSESYEGGELEFCGKGAVGAPLAAGTAIVFPSFLAHRVATITRGKRIALVVFADGPSFS